MLGILFIWAAWALYGFETAVITALIIIFIQLEKNGRKGS